MSKHLARFAFFLLVAWAVCGLPLSMTPTIRAEDPAAAPAEASLEVNAGEALFDGESLEGWEVLETRTFKGHGEVRVEEGEIVLDAGNPATGIRWTGDVPRMDYELSLQARRLEGNDFFCGLTFPVGDEPCTLIVGGWGGGVVGLSNVDGRHAEENETMSFQKFETGEWQQIRLRVTEERISAWIGEEQVVDLPTDKRKFSVWWEQEPAVPLGIATWNTKAAIKDVRLTRLESQADDWRPLFDGQTLSGWKRSEFGGAGEVKAEEGRIVIGFTDGCNGITWDGEGELPRDNYEISLEAMRVDGTDFFCGLTFPVGDAPCSLIVGGWGGAVVGLSSIDGQDAAENETTQSMGFKTGRWYRIRLKVAEGRIRAWIDDQPMVDLATKDRRISIRPEVEKSRPLGIASWCTTAALREIKLRTLNPDAPPPE